MGPAGTKFWRDITGAYELSPGEVETLRQAAHTVDLVSWLQVEVEGGPLTVRGSTGQPVANPLLGALAGQRRVLDELVRSLQLPMPDELEGRRRSPRAVAAAQKRWRDKRAGGLEGG